MFSVETTDDCLSLFRSSLSTLKQRNLQRELETQTSESESSDTLDLHLINELEYDAEVEHCSITISLENECKLLMLGLITLLLMATMFSFNRVFKLFRIRTVLLDQHKLITDKSGSFMADTKQLKSQLLSILFEIHTWLITGWSCLLIFACLARISYANSIRLQLYKALTISLTGIIALIALDLLRCYFRIVRMQPTAKIVIAQNGTDVEKQSPRPQKYAYSPVKGMRLKVYPEEKELSSGLLSPGSFKSPVVTSENSHHDGFYDEYYGDVCCESKFCMVVNSDGMKEICRFSSGDVLLPLDTIPEETEEDLLRERNDEALSSLHSLKYHKNMSRSHAIQESFGFSLGSPKRKISPQL